MKLKKVLLMDNNEFIKEAHDYIDNRYLLFRSYQKIVMDILKAFDTVCNKVNIEYVLAFGNLIGAVRDNRVQLPWDYDVDVTISYEDKEKLIWALENHLSKDYYYSYDNNTKKYPAPCLRVCKKGFTWMALHVDVFFLIGLPNNEIEQREKIKKIRSLVEAKNKRNYVYKQLEPITASPFKLFVSKLYGRIRYGSNPGRKLESLLQMCSKKYPIADSEFVMPIGTIATIRWKKEWLTPMRINLKEGMFPIPTHYDEMLKPIFGDYMSYTSFRSRYEEFYSMCAIVETRQSIYERIINETKEI